MKKRVMLILSCLFLSIGFILAQTTKISGTVVDKNGEAVIGASVVVKGTTIGVSTGLDGDFSIEVPDGKTTLVFSLVGMNTIEKTATPNMSVVMEDKTTILDDVVVVAYGTATKASLTGSAAQVKSEQLANASKEALDKALIGKTAGVRVSSNTGDPGAAGEISIRGLATVNGSSTPLYVIDGIPVEAGDEASAGLKSTTLLSSFNPDEIETVTVLKDAAAAAIYGSRATNGVILITTKKGKAGKTTIGYNAQFGWTSMAVKQFEMASAKETVDYYHEGIANYYMRQKPGLSKDAALALVLSEGDLEYFFADPFGNTNTNWRKQVYGTGFSQDHQVSLSGGNDKTKVFASLGLNDTEGYVYGNEFKRYSGRLNIDHEINNKFSIAFKQSISYRKELGGRDQHDQGQGLSTTSPLSIMLSMDPTAKVHNEDGSINASASMVGSKTSNPLLMLGSDQEFVRLTTFRSLSNGDITYKITPELTLKTAAGFDYINSKTFEFWGPQSVNGESLGGLGYRYDFSKYTLTSSTTLRYANTFGLHNIDVLGGFELMNAKVETISASSKSYVSGKYPELSNGQPYKTGSAAYGSALISYLATANYNYDQRYYLSASVRTDGSSFLGTDNRWATFPSASVAWRISKESFMPESDYIRDLKLRASIGVTGNLPNSYFADRRLYSLSGGYGADGAVYMTQAGNEKLGWEKTTSYNIGLDWNMWDRLNFSVEYYNRDTKDLLFSRPLSYITGYASRLTNIGKLNNKGIEIDINSRNIKTKNFSWNTNFNLAWQKGEIVKLAEGEDVPWGDGEMYRLSEGQHHNAFYLPTWAGVDPDTGNGTFWIDPKDHSKGTTENYSSAGSSFVGKPSPDILGGMTNTLTFKDFDFSFLITYQFGGDLFDYPAYFIENDGVRMGQFAVSKDLAKSYWKEAGDKVVNPKPIYGGTSNRSDRWSTRHIKSTDHIRVREIALGYNIPTRKLGNISKVVSAARLFVSANNPFMIWSKEDNIDPDVSLNGYRQVDTPVGKTFLFGFNLQF
ncbi:SusC/RagA family TonB-linked outer membrane protein [Dysgonomonas massiliensis]|uniref:SusC/RagA family TonB-linked outer membrane protein n=1 Tax=Dysgonomonas massiliensis TaxID=2040292 RepID=UPI00161537E2|nr:TonB-dependent receptor [Dysgonomonas massiliensis]